jgi:hypothetical protein
MFLDHHDVGDRHMNALREHFDDAEIVELSWAIGEFISLGKLVYVFGIPYGEAERAALGHAGHSEEEHAS